MMPLRVLQAREHKLREYETRAYRKCSELGYNCLIMLQYLEESDAD